MNKGDFDWLAQALGGRAFHLLDDRDSAPGDGPAARLASALDLPASEVTALLEEIRRSPRLVRPFPTATLLAEHERNTTHVLLVPERRTESSAPPASSAERMAELSHELGNAFGAILGWVGAARNVDGPGLGTRVHRALGSIEASTRAAEETTRHFLAEAEGKAPQATTVALSALLENIVALLEPSLKDKHVTVTWTVSHEAYVAAPEPLLFSLFWNLLENALDATPRLSVIHLSLERLPKDLVQIEVSDQGPGIPDAQRDQLFRRYYTTKPHGTGLGLPLVLNAVESLGGTLEVLPAKPTGTCMRVVLTAARSETVPPEAVRPRGTPGPRDAQGRAIDRRTRRGPDALRGRRLLLIENDAAMRDLLTTSLELCGCDVTARGRFDESMGLSPAFDVALIDYRLDDQQGDIVAERIRAQSTGTHIVFLSGSEPPATLTLGAAIWLRKPFSIDALLDQLRTLLSAPRGSHAG